MRAVIHSPSTPTQHHHQSSSSSHHRHHHYYQQHHRLGATFITTESIKADTSVLSRCRTCIQQVRQSPRPYEEHYLRDPRSGPTIPTSSGRSPLQPQTIAVDQSRHGPYRYSASVIPRSPHYLTHTSKSRSSEALPDKPGSTAVRSMSHMAACFVARHQVCPTASTSYPHNHMYDAGADGQIVRLRDRCWISESCLVVADQDPPPFSSHLHARHSSLPETPDTGLVEEGQRWFNEAMIISTIHV